MVDRPRRGRIDLFSLTKVKNMLGKYSSKIMILYHFCMFFLTGKSNKHEHLCFIPIKRFKYLTACEHV